MSIEDELEKVLKYALTNAPDAQEAYDAGYDCGINGPNETNSHFKFFASPGYTIMWERGKAAAEQTK